MATILGELFIEPLCKLYYPYCHSDREFSGIDLTLVDQVEIIFFTDISPNKSLYDYITERGKKIIICDHHDTGKFVLEQFKIEHYYYDSKRCGSKILFDKIFEGDRPKKVVKEVVDLVNTYDTWQKQSILWQQANDFVDFHMGFVNFSVTDSYQANYNFIKNMKLKLKFNSDFFYNNNELKIIQTRKNKRRDTYKKCLSTLKKRIDSSGNNYIYVELPSGISQLGNFILEQNPDCKYICIWNTYFKVKDDLKISLRSVNDFDVSVIASKFGGGGHLNASSFSFKDKDQFEKFIKGKIHLI